jgi:hypothetical protein
VPRIITEWSTDDDPQLAGVLRMLASIPEHEPERHELEAHLHMVLMRAAWREADRLRELGKRRARRTKDVNVR